MQLRTAHGRVLLGGQEPGPSELPADLSTALREWAEVAESVLGTGRPAETELVRRRGRQLAARVARQRGVPVEYVDPVTGAVEPVPAPAAEPEPAEHPNEQGADEPTMVEPAPAEPAASPAAAGTGWRPSPVPRGPIGRLPPEPTAEPTPEPTPWGTGLTVSAVVAVIVGITDVVLYQGLVDSTFVVSRGLGWLPLVANLLVGLGLAPSLWLLRNKPFWRWLAAGIAAGLVIGWIFVVLSVVLSPG